MSQNHTATFHDRMEFKKKSLKPLLTYIQEGKLRRMAYITVREITREAADVTFRQYSCLMLSDEEQKFY